MPERFAGLIVSDSTQWLDLATWRAHGWDSLGKVAVGVLSGGNVDPELFYRLVA